MKTLALPCETILPRNPSLMIHGIGVNGVRFGRQRIIPAIDSKHEFLSLVCNHDAIMARVDGEELEFQTDSIVLWDASHVVDYGFARSKWRISWIQVWGAGVDAAVEELALPLNKAFPISDGHAVQRRLMDMVDELRRYNEPDVSILLNHFRGLLLEMRRAASGELSSRLPVDKRLLRVKTLIDSRYPDGLTLGFLAKAACMSRHHLCRRFKAAFGSSPLEYMMKLRLDSAASSLVDRDLSVAEAASQSGFGNLSNFSKTFKRHFGVAPQAYRLKLLDPAP